MVASLSCEKVTLATQPAKKATRVRRGPAAGNAQPRRRKKKWSSMRGRRRSLSARPRSFKTPMPRDGLQAGALIETQNACGVNDAVRIGEQVPENEVARDASEPGAGIVALDARAGVLDEFSIFDPGGAGGFTGAAVETFVDVVDEGIRDGLLVQFDMNHLMDAAARRIGFEVPQAIGGAGIEAEAAMDTASIVLVDRSLAGDGGREHGLGCSEGRMIRLCRLDRKNCWCEGEVGGSEQEQGSRTPKGSAWEIIRELRGGCSRSRRNVCRR